MAERAPVTILNVNDDEASLYLLNRTLERAGYAVLAARTGRDALAQLERRPDLVVLDVRLPDMSGLEVARRIRERPDTARVAILHVSAHATRTEDRVEGLERGADGYLVLPVEPTELLATVRALLRMRAAEEATQRAVAAWEGTFEALTDGICVLDGQGRILRVNRALAALLEGRPEVLVGQPFVPLLCAGSSADARAREALATLGQRQSLELERGGRWLRVTADPISVPSGALQGAVRVVADVTAQKGLEVRLRQRAEALAEADRRKDEFLAMLGHELRNPLAAVHTGISLLQRRGSEPGVAQKVGAMVQRQTRHLARLVDDLLDVARINRGKLELRRERADLRQLARHALASSQSLHGESGHRVELALPELPVEVHVDPARLEQVLGNLLDNAMKYTEPGGTVSLRLEVQEDRAVVEVADTGVGIVPELLPRIFEAFTQAGQTLERARGGLGLGLALVHGLVEMHGGRVEAHSDGPGRGSRFRVELPLAAGAQPAHVSGPAAAEPSSSRRVLLVEDNADVREALKDLLEVSGHVVLEAADGLAGVQAALELRPDVALVDVGLPGLDGFEVARRIRASPLAAGLTLVALTGYGGSDLKRRALEAGFDLHLVKPVELTELERLLATLPVRG